MPVIELETKINASIELVFDLSRSIDLHKISTAHTNEEAVAGVTSGLIGPNKSVTWKARHFGIVQYLTSRITQFNRPCSFVDEMKRGIFKQFTHEHIFESHDDHTTMIDKFDYTSPLGLVGRIADFLFLKSYMKNLLIKRNEVVKDFAESEKWKQVINL